MPFRYTALAYRHHGLLRQSNIVSMTVTVRPLLNLVDQFSEIVLANQLFHTEVNTCLVQNNRTLGASLNLVLHHVYFAVMGEGYGDSPAFLGFQFAQVFQCALGYLCVWISDMYNHAINGFLRAENLGCLSVDLLFGCRVFGLFQCFRLIGKRFTRVTFGFESALSFRPRTGLRVVGS